MYSMFMANDVSVVEFRLSLEFDCRVRRLIASINKTVFFMSIVNSSAYGVETVIENFRKVQMYFAVSNEISRHSMAKIVL